MRDDAEYFAGGAHLGSADGFDDTAHVGFPKSSVTSSLTRRRRQSCRRRH